MFFKSKKIDDSKSNKVLENKVSNVMIDKLHIDTYSKLNDEYIFLSGWYFDTDLLSFAFDNAENEVSHIEGERKDVSIHHKHNGSFHNWGFTIIYKYSKNKAPKQLLVNLKNSKPITLSLKSPQIENIELCLERLNNYSKNQRNEVIQRLNEFEIEHENIINESTFKYYIEKSIRLNDCILIYGWINDSKQKIENIECTGNNIDNCNISLYRRFRKDVNQALKINDNNFDAGFVLLIEYPHEINGNHLELIASFKNRKTITIPISIEQSITNKVELTQQVIGNLDLAKDNVPEALKNVVIKALSDIWNHDLDRLSPITKEFNVAIRPISPRNSVIVPIYKRYDFILYQLAHFSNDEDFKEVELIYAIDDPSIFDAVLKLAETYAPLHKIYFKIVSWGQNIGFGNINNAAVQEAKGKKVVLVNSDILPCKSGWVRELDESHSKSTKAGILGVDLLFHDNSIQHAGMGHRWSDEFNIWLNTHPGKGLPKSLFNKGGIEQINTVTAACIIISKDVFQEVGGFDNNYILGDFEDSDLCFKLLSAGYQNYINHDIELYHLERQSQNLVESGDWKFKITLINGWQHSLKWGNKIKYEVYG